MRFQIDENIELRTLTEADTEAVFASVSENFEHLRAFMHWMVDDYSLKHAQDFIAESIESSAEKKSCGFGIFRNGRLIGSIGFVNFEWKARRTELGYWVANSEEGKGIITKASRILIDHAINEWKMNRIEIRCSALNARSAAVPERLGFTKEGVLRQCEFRNGRLHDFNIYGLLAKEWKHSGRGT